MRSGPLGELFVIAKSHNKIIQTTTEKEHNEQAATGRQDVDDCDKTNGVPTTLLAVKCGITKTWRNWSERRLSTKRTSERKRDRTFVIRVSELQA